MEREQIIKALECCRTNSEMDCIDCHYRNKVNDLYDGCVNTLLVDALSLIKELTEENERLKKALNTDISFVRVSRGNGKTAHLREVVRIRVDAIKADTVRKMQERIKEYFPYDADSGLYVVLDQIAKEMVEGTL